MNKIIMLLVSVSALSLAACGDQTAQNTPTTPPASTDATSSSSNSTVATPPASTDATKPAAGSTTAAGDTTAAGNTTAPAAAPASGATMTLDPTIQTMIDGLKVKAATMSAEEKTKSVADVRTAAETAARTAGKSDADIKSVGDAAEAAAKSALGI